jgi:hypothetical protein
MLGYSQELALSENELVVAATRILGYWLINDPPDLQREAKSLKHRIVTFDFFR